MSVASRNVITNDAEKKTFSQTIRDVFFPISFAGARELIKKRIFVWLIVLRSSMPGQVPGQPQHKAAAPEQSGPSARAGT